MHFYTAKGVQIQSSQEVNELFWHNIPVKAQRFFGDPMCLMDAGSKTTGGTCGNMRTSALSALFHPGASPQCGSPKFLFCRTVSIQNWCERPNQTDVPRPTGCGLHRCPLSCRKKFTRTSASFDSTSNDPVLHGAVSTVVRCDSVNLTTRTVKTLCRRATRTRGKHEKTRLRKIEACPRHPFTERARRNAPLNKILTHHVFQHLR